MDGLKYATPNEPTPVPSRRMRRVPVTPRRDWWKIVGVTVFVAGCVSWAVAVVTSR